MHKLNSKLLMAAALATALMAGCGGGGGGGNGNGGGAFVSTDISQSISALITFMNSLIADTSDTSDPIDINSLTLVTEDLAEPTAIN